MQHDNCVQSHAFLDLRHFLQYPLFFRFYIRRSCALLFLTGDSFTVHNDKDFERDVLTANYRHGKFSSFQRQLNMYGFRKVADCSDRTYSHPFFRRDCPNLLVKVRRVNPKTGKSTATHKPAAMTAVEGTTEDSLQSSTIAVAAAEAAVGKIGTDRDQSDVREHDHDDFGAETTGESEQGEEETTPAARKKRRVSVTGPSAPLGSTAGSAAKARAAGNVGSSSSAAHRPLQYWIGGNAGVPGVPKAKPVAAAEAAAAARKQSKSAVLTTPADKQAKAQARAQARAQAKLGGNGKSKGSNGALSRREVGGGGGGGGMVLLPQQTEGSKQYWKLNQHKFSVGGSGVASSWTTNPNSCSSPSTSSAASSIDSSPTLLPSRVGGGGSGGGCMPKMARGGAQGKPKARPQNISSSTVPPSPVGSSAIASSGGSGGIDGYWRRAYEPDDNRGNVLSAASQSSHTADCTQAMNSPGFYYGAWSGGGGGGGANVTSSGAPGDCRAESAQDQSQFWLDKAFGFGAALARCPSADLLFDANAAFNDDRLAAAAGGTAAAAAPNTTITTTTTTTSTTSGWGTGDHSELTAALTAPAAAANRGSHGNGAVILVTPTSADGGHAGGGGGDESGSSAMESTGWSTLASIGGPGWVSQLDDASDGVGPWGDLPPLGDGGSGYRGGIRSPLMLGGGVGKRTGGGAHRPHMRTPSTMSGVSIPGSESSAPFDWSLLEIDSALLQELGDVEATGGSGGGSNSSNGCHEENSNTNNRHRRTPSSSAVTPFPAMGFPSDTSCFSTSEGVSGANPNLVSSGITTTTAASPTAAAASSVFMGGVGFGGGLDAWEMGVPVTMNIAGAGNGGRPSATLFP